MVELQSGLEEWEKNSTLVVDVEAEEHSYLREQGERRREVEQHQRSHMVPCGSNERCACVCVRVCMRTCAQWGRGGCGRAVWDQLGIDYLKYFEKVIQLELSFRKETWFRRCTGGGGCFSLSLLTESHRRGELIDYRRLPTTLQETGNPRSRAGRFSVRWGSASRLADCCLLTASSPKGQGALRGHVRSLSFLKRFIYLSHFLAVVGSSLLHSGFLEL